MLTHGLFEHILAVPSCFRTARRLPSMRRRLLHDGRAGASPPTGAAGQAAATSGRRRERGRDGSLRFRSCTRPEPALLRDPCAGTHVFGRTLFGGMRPLRPAGGDYGSMLASLRRLSALRELHGLSGPRPLHDDGRRAGVQPVHARGANP